MRISYKQRLFLYFFIIFTLFTLGIIVFERSREMRFRTEALEEKLDAYTGIIQASLDTYREITASMDHVSTLLPENLRITLIDQGGTVLFDNALGENNVLDNHAERPEIAVAKAKGSGSHIRTSASNDQKYLYYAKRNSPYYIRVALPYNLEVQLFLKSDYLFLYYIVLLFLITLFVINYVADRFGKSIRMLNEFALSGGNETVEFPEDELGEIGRKIMDNYEQLQKSKKQIVLEREKLLQHVHSSGEGICFFSPERKTEFYNGLFIQYLNTLTDESGSDPAIVLTDPSFKPIVDFLSAAKKQDNYFETRIAKQGKHFHLQVNVFEDNSFEIIMNDITRQEKTRLLKQEMTSNIAHELRTPVTSIRGYLEIALNQSLAEEKSRDFLTKAHNQTLVLSELIQDMSLLTKMEEASISFQKEPVSIEPLLEDLRDDLKSALSKQHVRFEWKNMTGATVYGNRNLLYSIFRNLTDNAIRYAGPDITITVNKYNEDKNFLYLSFADTGVGIPEEHHLNRLFERFYRVNEGRTRDSGGSGLGLSIVKNAVLFHKGTIVAKNRTGGGLEFLFKLSKAKG